MDIVDIQPDGTVQLAIHHDPYCESDGREHFQWCAYRPPSFHFAQVNPNSCVVENKFASYSLWVLGIGSSSGLLT